METIVYNGIYRVYIGVYGLYRYCTGYFGTACAYASSLGVGCSNFWPFIASLQISCCLAHSLGPPF